MTVKPQNATHRVVTVLADGTAVTNHFDTLIAAGEFYDKKLPKADMAAIYARRESGWVRFQWRA